ncbi:MAG: hypothetical protein ACK4MS_10475 [Paracoccaceae bacterium]
MPRHTSISVAPGAAVALSDGPVAAVRVHNAGVYAVVLQATATNVPPTSPNGGVTLAGGATLAADLPLEDLFPGIGSGPLYLWAMADMSASLSVSHA